MYCYEDTYAPSFRERMDDAQEAARTRVESRAYLRGRITYQRPAMRQYWTVARVAAYMGVSESRVKLLCAKRRIRGARRAGQGRGTPWRVPVYRHKDGKYHPTITPGKRGPKLKPLSPTGIVPF
jgi:hypothetical protein